MPAAFNLFDENQMMDLEALPSYSDYLPYVFPEVVSSPVAAPIEYPLAPPVEYTPVVQPVFQQPQQVYTPSAPVEPVLFPETIFAPPQVTEDTMRNIGQQYLFSQPEAQQILTPPPVLAPQVDQMRGSAPVSPVEILTPAPVIEDQKRTIGTPVKQAEYDPLKAAIATGQLSLTPSSENLFPEVTLEDGTSVLNYSGQQYWVTKPGQDLKTGMTIELYSPEGVFNGTRKQTQYGNVVVDELFDASGNSLGRSVFPVGDVGKAAIGGFLTVLTAGLGGPAGIGSALGAETGSLAASALGGAVIGGAGAAATGGDVGKGALFGGLGAAAGQAAGSYFNNLNYDATFAAADAAQLADQGLSANQIAQNLSTYVDPTIAQNMGNLAASQAASGQGASISDLVNEYNVLASVKAQPQTPQSQITTTPATGDVVIESSRLPVIENTYVPSVFENVSPEVLNFLANTPVTTTPPATEQVPVTEQVTVTEKPVETQSKQEVPSLFAVTPPATEQVPVTEQKAKEEEKTISAPVTTPTVTEKPIEAEKQQPETKTEEQKKKEEEDLKTLLKIFESILAGAGTGGLFLSGGSTGFGDIPKSEPIVYSPEYFSSIQKYYNTYMPEYPRDVSTPLQQWYETKYGA